MNMSADRAYKMTVLQIVKTGHWITDQVGLVLKEDGITEPQFNVLRILKGRQGRPVTVKEIQQDMIQRSSNVTRIVDKLIDKGLVSRKECPSNRRKMDVLITPKGEDFLKILNEKIEYFHELFHKKITEEEWGALDRIIKKLTDNVV